MQDKRLPIEEISFLFVASTSSSSSSIDSSSTSTESESLISTSSQSVASISSESKSTSSSISSSLSSSSESSGPHKLVTGVITPVIALGLYTYAGTFNGQPYYVHTVFAWSMWYDTVNWNITIALNDTSLGWWGPTLNGNYPNNYGAATGTAVVSSV